ncbi:peptide transporter PTR2-A [Pyrenophora seminiperda CCB06]|uniref:Peptide transporter PTR2-A n=1 Tax=Pyrenophora seminiperda CCB06 TaxID=1302712 RepID=A0A3M7MDG9_9PLEO|nr:peptide transporter PTR2-A [Pyrenophora seminiperda CCB06]
MISAIAQAFVPLTGDLLLVWLYASIAILNFLCRIGFARAFRSLNKVNDKLDKLPEATLSVTLSILQRKQRVSIEHECDI